jgi:hypothetical protein
MAELKSDAIVHTAAQPSHDRAAAIPFDDFDTKAVGTLNLLEATHQSRPQSPFVHLYINKGMAIGRTASLLRNWIAAGATRLGLCRWHLREFQDRLEQALAVRCL